MHSEFEEVEHNEYADPDNAESNLKKRRHDRAGVDSFQTTGPVGHGLGSVSKRVASESRREEGGASLASKKGLDEAVELLQLDQVRGVPQGGLDVATKRDLHDMLDKVKEGLDLHQKDERCKQHDRNCRFRLGRRFDPVCVGIAVTRLVVEHARGAPDDRVVEVLAKRQNLTIKEARHQLGRAKQMVNEARRSLEHGRAASHYEEHELRSSESQPPPVVRRCSPRLAPVTAGSSQQPPVEPSPASAGSPPTRQVSLPLQSLSPYPPEKELYNDLRRLLGSRVHNQVLNRLRLFASGTVRRLYKSAWKPQSETARAVALALAHRHVHASQPELVGRGLVPPFADESEYGRAVGMDERQPGELCKKMRKLIKKAKDAGVADGAQEGSF